MDNNNKNRRKKGETNDNLARYQGWTKTAVIIRKWNEGGCCHSLWYVAEKLPNG